MIEIPLKSGARNARQQFTITLGGNRLMLRLSFITYTGTPTWSMDVLRDGTVLAAGLMLEPGCDVIEQYNAGIGRLVFVGERATIDNLGIDNHLIWTPE